MNISNELKRIRKELGLSQSNFAKLLNVDYSTISRTERNIQKPRKSFINKLKRFAMIKI